MMESADGESEFVADLSTERARLRETNVMGFRGCSTADDAWLRGDEFAVLLVAQADGLRCNATAAYGRGARRGCRARGWVFHRRKERLFNRRSESQCRRRLRLLLSRGGR